MKNISLLGATGSIGKQTLDIIGANPEQFRLTAMSAGKNIADTEKIIQQFQPKLVCVMDKDDAERLKHTSGSNTRVVYGEEGLIETAAFHESDVLLNAVMGSVGLRPTVEAIREKKTIALANKETLVTAGHLVMDEAKKHKVSILPVDSEHSAIFQCLQGEKAEEAERLILTASGGSFRDKTREELKNVTVQEALNHPNWSMGAKITIDSATMMNKGLEVIEAFWLFSVPYSKIDVILHKESIIHSMVEYKDTSIIAHLGQPDMRVPIQYALSYPNRFPMVRGKKLNLWELGALHFQQMDFTRFRCLQLAYHAGEIGGTMTTVLNAANEKAVEHFLKGNLSFLGIEECIEQALEAHDVQMNPAMEAIEEADRSAREYVDSLITKGRSCR